jgi:hypothetical protein
MKNVLIISYVLFIVLISCNKEPVTNNVYNGFQSIDFPIKVGNWWKYKVTDFYGGTIDTLIVEVVDKITNETYRCELRYNNSVVDSAIITVSETTLSYEGLNQDYSYFGNFKLTFPFNDNDSWIGFYNPDTVVVTSVIDDFTINGMAFSPVYNLKRSFFLGGGYSLTQFMMITPEIGIINQSIDLFDGANAQKQNFDIIEYNLN